MERSAAGDLAEALALPAEALAEIAARLIGSLDDAIDHDAKAARPAEIARRIRDVDEGRTDLVPWTDVQCRRAHP